MKRIIAGIFIYFVLANRSASFAEEIKGRVVDGLGRPLGNVTMIFSRDGDVDQKSNSQRVQTASDGSYSVSMDGPIDKDHWLDVSIRGEGDGIEGGMSGDKKE